MTMTNFCYSTPTKTRLVMTTALPYANGNLHIGHGSEAIQADIFARYRRLTGQTVIFVCADDCHGTAIELLAASQKKSPERVLREIGARHRADFARIKISFDEYHQTHSPENEAIAFSFFDELKTGGHLKRKNVPQLFDAQAGRYLDDRRVRGTCPSCGLKDQYGDACECGATYDAIQLLDPASTLTGSRPQVQNAEHLFFQIKNFADEIRAWLDSGAVQKEVRAKLLEWLDEGLRDWCITRNGPYFGIPVPGEPGLFFYVWLDAPIGYLSTLQHYLNNQPGDANWADVWGDENTEIRHFIGKDIINFHGLFWPALLCGAHSRLPDRLHAHGFVTVGGHKMSKSRGNSVELAHLLDQLGAEALRYAIAAQMNDGIADFNIDAEAVADKVNSDLVGKIANIAIRLRPLIAASGNVLSDVLPEPALYEKALGLAQQTLDGFETVNSAAAVRAIVALADLTNEYVNHNAPWTEIDPEARCAICSQALSQFRLLAALIQPICPGFAERCLAVFGVSQLSWKEMGKLPLGQQIAIPPRLFDRIDAASLSCLETNEIEKEALK